MLNLQAAKEELDKKDYHTIQTETAWKWASRAVVEFDRMLRLDEFEAALTFGRAHDYLGEAKEHAAQVDPDLLKKLIEEVNPYMFKALSHLTKGTP